VMKVFFRSFTDGITPYLHVNPYLANTGSNDKAWIDNNTWFAQEGDAVIALKTDAAVEQSTVGFIGESDGVTQLTNNKALSALYNSTGEAAGNVGITLQLPTVNSTEAQWQFVLGFGTSEQESLRAAQQTLSDGYAQVLARFNGQGEAIGWEDYLQSLPQLAELSATTTDNGKLLYTSALVLKAQEDKTHTGALIASLSNPWGETKTAEESKTGYKAVWPRDFYQVAMAMPALGDKQTQ